MRVPYSWLKDFAAFGPALDLVGELDGLGLVVEGVEQVGEGLGDIVVVRVSEISAIEGADRIRRVVVDAGGKAVQIVCGAWNFEVGDLVPLAPVGTVLPGGMEIGRRKMKGVASEGMLCSGKELGLSDDSGGLLVLGSDAEGAVPGMPLTEALGIERDTVFDIAVEANRPDAMCVAGVARDLAARLKLEFTLPTPPELIPVTASGFLESVEVPDPDLCPRFTARVLTGFTIRQSPAVVARRLVLAGMRPLNNVVDASNYVMLELGQPTHPYDLDRVARQTLRARAGVPGEVVVTLDGVERRIAERSVGPGDQRRDCLICDGDDVPIGIGGVMGGASTEISETTDRVLLEAAYFLPMAIARTSLRLGLRTEASIRFERGCDPEGIDLSVRRLCEVLGWSAGDGFGVLGDPIDVRGEVPKALHVSVRPGRLNKILGTELDATEIASYLEPIGFRADRQNDGTIEVTVPTFRPDTTREIDVIEEVARHHGYQSIARLNRRPAQVGALTPFQRSRRRLRAALAHTGAHEAWTPSLIQPGDHERSRLVGPEISVVNPLTPDESVLRRSLMPGLLRALEFNVNRRQGGIRLFEVGNVFDVPSADHLKKSLEHSDPALPVAVEREVAGLLLAGPTDDAKSAAAAWKAIADATGIDGVDVDQVFREDTEEHPHSWTGWGRGLHPTRRASLVITEGEATGTAIGEVGEIDPEVITSFGIDATASRVGWLMFDVGMLFEHAPARSDSLAPVSRYPSADIDLAFVVSETVAASKLEQTLRHAGGELLERIWLFDVYRGAGLEPGERSLAFRLRFCAVDRTLTDGEVATLRSECIAAAENEHQARIRS
ncbi:MAG: phenylalanine--tRNA ligase subunit beta [Acidimicrobiales bacterium]